ncbi:MAG TPA: hypothetical protein DCZ71_05480 [Ruminococcus sp.]|nr:hypothetical protein [Ruminococcus sp.]
MANILDYMTWRGDVPLSVSPFNEVDGLILSEFSYLPMDKVFTEGFNQELTVREIAGLYNSEEVDEKDRIISFEDDNRLLSALAESERFGNMRVSGYVNIISQAAEFQFSAVTCTADDGVTFVSFRGTDGTVVGWKEDFTFSYTDQTTGQHYAVSYLNTRLAGSKGRVRVGGHSKGGNFAVYASAYCDPLLRERIDEIYSYDAPGFRKEITDSAEYRAVLPLIKSFIPESSVVGMLLESDSEQVTVKSSAMGIMQHLAYNWEVLGRGFVRTEKLSRSGALVNRAISGMLADFTDEDRKNFTEAVFGVLEAPEKMTLKEVVKGKFASYSSMFRALRELPPEQQNILREALKQLAKNAVRSDDKKGGAH